MIKGLELTLPHLHPLGRGDGLEIDHPYVIKVLQQFLEDKVWKAPELVKLVKEFL